MVFFMLLLLLLLLLLIIIIIIILLLLLLLLLLHCSWCYNIIGAVFVIVNKSRLGLKSNVV